MNNKNGFKQELKYWLPIIAIIVSSAVAFTSLKNKVDAMVSREQTNKTTFIEFVRITTDKLDLIIGNQIQIATELGIDIERK